MPPKVKPNRKVLKHIRRVQINDTHAGPHGNVGRVKRLMKKETRKVKRSSRVLVKYGLTADDARKASLVTKQMLKKKKK